MHTDYSHDLQSWTWHCIWGCSDYGYITQEGASDAFLSHNCKQGAA